MDASGVEEKGEREKFELQSKLVATQNEVMELEMQQKARSAHTPPAPPRLRATRPQRQRAAAQRPGLPSAGPWSALGPPPLPHGPRKPRRQQASRPASDSLAVV